MSVGLAEREMNNVELGFPRRPSLDEIAAVVAELTKWSSAKPNIDRVLVFTHQIRPTIRCAVVSLNREYDPVLDDAVSEFDLQLAQRPESRGIDFEVRIFFAASADQVAAWTRDWELWPNA